MLNRSLISVLFVVSSFVLAAGQIPDRKVLDADKTARPEGQKMRDVEFSKGVDLQFLIKELALEMDLNVLFDSESFRTPGRKAFFELKNVTAAEAFDGLLQQEKLYFEVAGPKTILVAAQPQAFGVRPIGVGTFPMSDQLAKYFGVDGGILVNTVRDDSPALKAGLKAGDVIVEMDGTPYKGALGLTRAIDSKNGADITLKIVRDHKSQTVTLTPVRGIQSVL